MDYTAQRCRRLLKFLSGGRSLNGQRPFNLCISMKYFKENFLYPVFFYIRYILISGIIIIIKCFQIDRNRNFKNHFFNLQN